MDESYVIIELDKFVLLFYLYNSYVDESKDKLIVDFCYLFIIIYTNKK